MTDGEAVSAAFGAVGNGTRIAAVRALYADGDCPTRTFTEVFEDTDADTTAGFAYHLRQLTDTFVTRVEGDGDEPDRYRLTDAGRRLARSIAAGTYTTSTDHDEMTVPDPCPLCGASALSAAGADNVLTIGCGGCDRVILALAFPPAGHDRDDAALLAAFDRYHRHRIAAAAEGTCPDCGGDVTGRVAMFDPDADGNTGAGDRRAITHLACATCGYAISCPVTLAVRSHPAVVAQFERADEDIRERPVWNVGAEWSERVLSTDPVCVEVAAEVDDELLVLLVGRDLTVVEIKRSTAGDRDEQSDETRDAAAA